jgi:hypothetical protein
MNRVALSLASFALFTTLAIAAEPKALFNGKDLTGWQNAKGEAPNPGWVVEDGVLSLKGKKVGDLWTKDRYGDFILELEFKTTGNSGVFFRTDNPSNNVQTGIEIQVDVPHGKPDKHSVGCIYDLVPPTTENAKKDDWNTMKITAKGNLISVDVNGQKVSEMDLDKWTEAGKNPDGTKNKFKTALKDFKREGHIGFQDHGNAVQYRNVRLTVEK